MSISSLSTLAVARTKRTPTRSDAGSRTDGLTAATADSKSFDILVKTVPTEVVALYTAFMGIVTSLVKSPTVRNPHPNEYLPIRWFAFAALIFLAAFFTIAAYRGKNGRGIPVLATLAATVAATAWGLALPASPLLTEIHDTTEAALTAALISFIGAGMAYGFSLLLKSPNVADNGVKQ